MGYLAAECLKCGFQFDIHAETIEAQRDLEGPIYKLARKVGRIIKF